MKSCLILEDIYSRALKIKKIVSESGFDRIDIVDSFKEAIKHLNFYSYNLILSAVIIRDKNAIDFFSSQEVGHNLLYITSINSKNASTKSQFQDENIVLVKPFDKNSLNNCLEVIQNNDRSEKTQKGSIIIKSKGIIHNIDVDSIKFIESEGNYCTLHTINEEFITRSSLTKYNDLLKSKNLCQTHRKFIVNLKHIQSVNISESLINIGTRQLAIGRKYKKDFFKKYRVGY